MLKKYLCWLLSGVLLLCVAAQPVGASRQGDKQDTTVETIKSEVAKIGVGEKASNDHKKGRHQDQGVHRPCR